MMKPLHPIPIGAEEPEGIPDATIMFEPNPPNNEDVPPFQFQIQLAEMLATIVIVNNQTGDRWHMLLYSDSGELVKAMPLIASPPRAVGMGGFNLVDGVSASRLVFRDDTDSDAQIQSEEGGGYFELWTNPTYTDTTTLPTTGPMPSLPMPNM